jgi:hypothetical protein
LDIELWKMGWLIVCKCKKNECQYNKAFGLTNLILKVILEISQFMG